MHDIFLDTLATVFPHVHSHEVGIFNPRVREADSNWIVLAGVAERAVSRE